MNTTSCDTNDGGDPAFHLRQRIRDLETGNTGLGEANQRLLGELEAARKGAEAAILKINQLRTKSQQAAAVIIILSRQSGHAEALETISSYFFQSDAFDPGFLAVVADRVPDGEAPPPAAQPSPGQLAAGEG